MPYDQPRPPGTLAVVLKGYPRLSETFIAQELKALEDRGLKLRIYSLRHPYDATSHPIHAEIKAPVTYLPEYLHQEKARVRRDWQRARRLPGYRHAARLFRNDLRRDRTRNRVRRFGQACVLAAELAPDVQAIYAHFLHTPGSVGRYAAHMCGLPLAMSGHAKDIWTTPGWELEDKASDAAWITTCTAVGAEYLRQTVSQPSKVRLARHGIDLRRFQLAGSTDPQPDNRFTILSVGRLVEKKGYGDLLAALKALPDQPQWRFVHIGGGELKEELQAEARSLGLDSHIDWLGPQPQQVVLEWLRRADVFVLASRIAKSGDRDGLPNVLMEAQSQALACISTSVSAIPELIEPDVTGILVPPSDPSALAHAIGRLAQDSELRMKLGRAGMERVHSDFSMTASADRLAGWLGDLAYEPAPG